MDLWLIRQQRPIKDLAEGPNSCADLITAKPWDETTVLPDPSHIP